MTENKRRLGAAQASSALVFSDETNAEIFQEPDCFAECNDNSGFNRRKSVNSRRRSSFGGAGSRRQSLTEAEQTRISEMYKTVIQMSSENVR